MKRINVAISFAVMPSDEQSIFSNGGNQHCVYLYMLMKHLPMVNKVWLVHSDGINQYSKSLLLEEIEQDTKQISEVINQVDLLIEMGASLAPEHVRNVRERGGKVVSYRFGNDYVISVEVINFSSIEWVPNIEGNQFDEVWTNAQHERTCKSFFEATYNAPCFVLPHLWSPIFIERYLKSTPPSDSFGYTAGKGPKRISIFEPNLNVVKSCLIPMLACDVAYRSRPDLFKHIYITNSFAKKNNIAFAHFTKNMQMVKDNKATSEGRFLFVPFAAEYTDIIVSHQWENDLNYLFYDALYGGYPLVHNSPRLKDVGYFYNDFNIQEGSEALLHALTEHDQNVVEYNSKSRKMLAKLQPDYAENLRIHSERVENLFSK